MGLNVALDRFRKRPLLRNCGLRGRVAVLPGCFVIALLNQVGEAPLGKLAASGAERFPNPLPVVDSVDVKGTIAPINTGVSAPWSEELAGYEMPTIWVEVAFCFHDATLPQGPPNQWISSFVVRAACTRPAALGDTMMVV